MNCKVHPSVEIELAPEVHQTQGRSPSAPLSASSAVFCILCILFIFGSLCNPLRVFASSSFSLLFCILCIFFYFSASSATSPASSATSSASSAHSHISNQSSSIRHHPPVASLLGQLSPLNSEAPYLISTLNPGRTPTVRPAFALFLTLNSINPFTIHPLHPAPPTNASLRNPPERLHRAWPTVDCPSPGFGSPPESPRNTPQPSHHTTHPPTTAPSPDRNPRPDLPIYFCDYRYHHQTSSAPPPTPSTLRPQLAPV